MMKQIMACISSLLMLGTFSTAWALGLSLNQTHFLPGDTLILTLDENWSGDADVYVAVTLPADDTLFFLSPPQNFGLDLVPYAVSKPASGSVELLRMDLPVLPVGEYKFYAAAMRAGSPFDIDMVLDLTSISLIFATDNLAFSDTRLPDGVIGRSYNFAVEPVNGTPPYQFSLSSGTLPDGLTLDSGSGLIQGQPTAHGMAQFTVQAIDAGGNVGEIEGAIKVFGILSFGEHGTFKECNGLQMAFNSVQDLNEIRIEQGTYECHGLSIPSNKSFEHGIKISGGWDGSFESQSNDPALTVFDGKEEESGILSVSAGPVAIEGLSFQNGKGAINAAGHGLGVSVTNCVFTKNDRAVSGAGNITNSTFTNNTRSRAVSGAGNITNSIFTNNTGGTVYGAGNITNSTFTNNTGGGVSNSDNIINSTFTNNSSAVYESGNIINSTFTNTGRAVSLSGNITNSIFTNNSRAVTMSGNITNSIFTNNSSAKDGGGAVYGSGNITNSIFTNNSAKNGGAVYGSGGTIVNCTLVNNSASDSGGAFYGSGTILNSIFAQNKVGEEANDIASRGKLQVDYTLVNDIAGVVDLGTHFIMGEPRFVDAENGDFHLRSDSPAINVGDSSVIESCASQGWDNSCRNTCDNKSSDECKARCYVCTRYSYPFLKDDNGNALDFDGNPRVVGGAIDLGAYESQ